MTTSVWYLLSRNS